MKILFWRTVFTRRKAERVKGELTVSQEENTLKRHLVDLAARAESGGYYVYSEFLTLADQALLAPLAKEGVIGDYTLYGGYEGAQRQLCGFGSEDAFGYPPDFPAIWIAMTPVSQKFADALTHRDFLGSLMGLGIRREVLGDILVHENVGYLFALENMAGYISEHLRKVRHTDVCCTLVASPPVETVALPDEAIFVVAGERLDAFVASVYRLSRSQSASLIEKGLVAIDGRVTEKGSVAPCEGAVISVRGYGRFLYCGVVGDTRRGKLRIAARVY